MVVGDIIRFTELERIDIGLGNVSDYKELRMNGVILNFSTYASTTNALPECIVEVLWNTGNIGWISKNRIERMSQG